MAEGLLRHFGGDRVEVESAGTVATHVHPLAVAAMTEKGIDLAAHRSKHLDEFATARFDYVITVCDNAQESCPLFPGGPEQIHWSLPDPSAAEGDEPTRLQAFRAVADDLTARIGQLLVQVDRESA